MKKIIIFICVLLLAGTAWGVSLIGSGKISVTSEFLGVANGVIHNFDNSGLQVVNGVIYIY
jgi:hypothetical protein